MTLYQKVLSVFGLIRNSLDLRAAREELAPLFDAGRTYAPGRLVVYGNALYRCVVQHTGDWNAEHFAVTTIEEAINDLNTVKITNPTGGESGHILTKTDEGVAWEQGVSHGYSFANLTPTVKDGYKVFAAQDHAVNRFTLEDDTPVKLVVPNATDTNGRNFIVEISVTADTMPTFEVVKPADASSIGFEVEYDGWNELEPGINYFTITETDRAG